MKPRQRLLIATFFALAFPFVLMALLCGCETPIPTNGQGGTPELFGVLLHHAKPDPDFPKPKSEVIYHADPPPRRRFLDPRAVTTVASGYSPSTFTRISLSVMAGMTGVGHLARMVFTTICAILACRAEFGWKPSPLKA